MIETCICILGYRRICQDAAGVFTRPQSTVIAVADGAGGIEDGEMASRSVISAIRQAGDAAGAIDWAQVLRQADHGIASGQAVPRSFTSPWSGGPLIVASDGLWNYVKRDRLVEKLFHTEFPLLAKTLAEMSRLASGDLPDDVAVVCARRTPRRRPAAGRIDLTAEDP